MDHASFVRRFERLSDLLRDRQRVVNRDRSLRDPVRQRRAFYQFEDQRSGAPRLLDAVYASDVGVVEAGQHLRFPLEPRKSIRIIGEGVRQNLQGDLAVELGVGGLPDLPHPAFANEGGHVVAPYALESHWVRPETDVEVARTAARL